jgi:hypothetical protein
MFLDSVKGNGQPLWQTNMPSNAFIAFEERLKEIEQLLAAHTALLRFYRASAAAQGLALLRASRRWLTTW